MSVPTPTVGDTYARVMAPAFDEKDFIGVSTLFQSMFGGPSGVTIQAPDAEVVTLNITRGNEKTSKWVVRGSDSQNIGPDKKDLKITQFTELQRVFPLTEETDTITSNELIKRLPTEKLYEPLTKQERARILAMTYHFEHVKRILRKQEVAASEALRDAQQTVTEGATTEKILFPRNANLSKALATPFSNAATDVDGEFLIGCQNIRKYGRAQANGCLIGSQSFIDLINRTDMQSLADNRRLSFLSMGREPGPMPADPVFEQIIKGGGQYEGWFKVGPWTLHFFTYIDGYDTDADVFTEFMPNDETLLFATRARRDRQFGPSDILPPDGQTRAVMADLFGISPEGVIAALPQGIKNSAIIDPNMFYLSAERKGNKTYEINTQAAPLYVPAMVDATYQMTATA
jgi:hypothetical protein